MTTAAIREKLHSYIRFAEDKKIKAIYTMLESEIADIPDHWNDPDFLNELNKRSDEVKKGRVKTVSWKDAKTKILNSQPRKRNVL
ncbi:hypothetical protein QTN47_07365 [Danxiaibacter flavus]|uniref:Addiction module component n=1 Tax=Danxiaibacter flavus TaxID=3049108 RepID=A0ABV3ZBT0_9BACT|nr:hypothetical protein QNM32_07365 [Chitinophagaceae bacterium DXS]